MAMADTQGQLTEKQVQSLAEVFTPGAMESVATGYMGIDRETIEELKEKYGLLDTFIAEIKDREEFNRHVIELWIREHPGPDQIRVSKSISIVFF